MPGYRQKMMMRSSLVRMRSILVVRASDCQCTSCYGPGFDPSIRRHSGIWGAADEAVLNIVRTKRKKSPKKILKKKNWQKMWELTKRQLGHKVKSIHRQKSNWFKREFTKGKRKRIFCRINFHWNYHKMAHVETISSSFKRGGRGG